MKSDFSSVAGFWDFWVWIFLAATISLLPIVRAFDCPPNNDGRCKCFSAESVECSDTLGALTQAYINEFFSKLRLHNGLANETLEMYVFRLMESNLLTFDLTPLLRTKISSLDIHKNSKLTRLIGPSFGAGDGLIQSSTITIIYNDVMGEGLGEALKLFKGSEVDDLDLSSNHITIVPDLSTFGNLRYLDLRSNAISEIKGESFRKLMVLRRIKLTANPIKFVRESAFLIDPAPPNNIAANFTLSIDLEGTSLKSENFSPKSGIDKIKRPVYVYLNDDFDSLPQDAFQPFLEANRWNNVSLKELQCDRRVKWLQDRKEEFQKKVKGANCSNDRGKTVWDSAKVTSGWPVQEPGILISLSFPIFFIHFSA